MKDKKLMINRIGFGGWQLGNKLWGNMSYQEGINLVKEAYHKGINFFDTAPGYSDGLSEKIIGEALHDVRDQVIINTKLGHLADGTSDFSVESLENQINMSLKRLNTTYLDSVLLHNPSFDILEHKTTHFDILESLKQKGIIHAYGVSIDTYDELQAVLEHTNVGVIELLFNVFSQSTLPLFDKIKEKDIKLIIKVPLDSGWLTGKYNHQSTFTGIRARWDKKTIEKRATLIDMMKDITGLDDLILPSLAFILSFDAVTAIIPGIKNSEQLNHNLLANDYILEKDMKLKLLDLYEKHIKNNPLPW